MTSLPTRESILDDAIVTSDWKTYYGDIRDYVSLLPFAQVSAQVTISNNAITVSSSANKVLAENNSPVTIDNIKTDGLQDSQLLLLYKGDEQNNISLKNGGVGDGSIATLENKDVPLSMDFPVILQRDGNNWKQIDLIGSMRATEEDIDAGTSLIKFPTVAQMKPYMGTAISAQLGVIVYSMKPAVGCLECNDEEHIGSTYKTLYAAIVDGTLPSVSYEEYQSQSSSSGFCEKFGLDADNGKFKCPNLSSVKFGETTYKAYVGAWNTAEKNIMDLQGILDQCLVVQTEINEKGEEINTYVEQSLQQLTELKDSSVQEITQTKTSSLEEITTQETTSLANIEQKRVDSINSVEAKRLEITSVGQGEIDKLNSLSTSLTNSFNTNAQEKQALVDASAEEARKWAIGTEEERPEGSAHYWANIAKGQTIPNQDGNDGKFLATDGSKAYWGDALDYTDITNCITKIPQDIKLELSDGTLTLKAGSKVYVPNGVGKFDEIIIDEDYSGFDWIESASQYTLFYNKDTKTFDACETFYAFSGTSFPDSPQNGYRCYRTDENKIYVYKNTKWIEGESLPIGIITGTKTLGKIASIDQVFNGFGYIGSTIFALPGIEGLIPNGRNTDGSLNNIKFTTKNILFQTIEQNESNQTFLALSDTFFNIKFNVYYDEYFNFIKGIHTKNILNYILIGNCAFDSNNKITSFNTKKVFQAIDVDLSNISTNIDYIVESDSNYIKFKSGKLIQWQNLASGAGTARVVNLIKPYANTSYSVMVTVGNITSGSPAYITMNVTSRTTTNFTTGKGGGTCEISWLAIGQGA